MSPEGWSCYRRNYIQIRASCSFSSNREGGYSISVNGSRMMVEKFTIGIESFFCDKGQEIDLIQRTAKRDHGPKLLPPQLTVIPNGTDKEGSVLFERLHTTAPTERRGLSSPCYILLSLYAWVGTQTYRICTQRSAPLVVRGKSKKYFEDMQKRGPSPSSEPATPGSESSFKFPKRPSPVPDVHTFKVTKKLIARPFSAGGNPPHTRVENVHCNPPKIDTSLKGARQQVYSPASEPYSLPSYWASNDTLCKPYPVQVSDRMSQGSQYQDSITQLNLDITSQYSFDHDTCSRQSEPWNLSKLRCNTPSSVLSEPPKLCKYPYVPSFVPPHLLPPQNEPIRLEDYLLGDLEEDLKPSHQTTKTYNPFQFF
jgi:hypothetical protein